MLAKKGEAVQFLFIILCTLSVALGAIPPKTMPENLKKDFTMGGKISVYSLYRDDRSLKPVIYTQSQVNDFTKKIRAKKTFYYGKTDTYLYQAFDKYKDEVKGKTVGIIGSVTPLYESIVLAWGGKPVTIDYNKIESRVASIRTMTVDEYEKHPLLFDVILSISSIEHDGLGRYGDPLSPNGDLEAMKKHKAMLKKGGLLFFAVPVGKDAIYWNAHRIYGRERLPKLLQGWKTIDSFGYHPNDTQLERKEIHQPLFVLKDSSAGNLE